MMRKLKLKIQLLKNLIDQNKNILEGIKNQIIYLIWQLNTKGLKKLGKSSAHPLNQRVFVLLVKYYLTKFILLFIIYLQLINLLKYLIFMSKLIINFDSNYALVTADILNKLYSIDIDLFDKVKEDLDGIDLELQKDMLLTVQNLTDKDIEILEKAEQSQNLDIEKFATL